MDIEQIRSELKPTFGYVFRDETLFIRIPKTSVYELRDIDIFNVYNIIKRRFGAIENIKTLYIVTEKSHIGMTSDIFSQVIQDKITIEEILRSSEKYKISDVYKDLVKRLLDEITINIPTAKITFKGGRRTEIVTKGKRGRTVRYRIPMEIKNIDIALIPSIKTAAIRRGPKNEKFEIKTQDIRENVKRRRVSASIAIIYDSSGSIGNIKKLYTITAIIRLILTTAYERRDEVGLISYSGSTAKIECEFTRDMSTIDASLKYIKLRGTTPLASGLWTGIDLLKKRYGATSIPTLVLITDGTANVPLTTGANIFYELYLLSQKIKSSDFKLLVFDISEKGERIPKRLAILCGGKYYHVKF